MSGTMVKLWRTVLFGVLAASLAAISAYLPFVVFVPILIVGMTLRHEPQYGIITALIFFVLTYFLIGLQGAVLSLLAVLPCSLVLYLVFKRKVSSYESIIISIGSLLLSFGLIWLYFILVYGNSPLDVMLSGFQANLEEMSGTSENGVIQYLFDMFKNPTLLNSLPGLRYTGIEGATRESMVSFILQGMESAIRMSTLPVVLYLSMTAGFINYVATHATLKKSGAQVAYMPPFAKYRLPKSFFRGAALLFLLSFLLFLLAEPLGLGDFSTVYSTVSGLLRFIFAIQGCAILESLLKTRNVPWPVRAIIILLCLFMLQGVMFFVGLVDQIFDIRGILAARRKTDNKG